ncbi:GntR family transcriptional regulator [Telmatospirillum sp. J64-1]|uniref:GntR family transcriptional regulator n=1 Tax=Telmatospirillum sp. J64-1 TaxID=2502183 RepID=UPI0021072548|nr:GntR family transcriptional regulator [Telmatospirillum sp. J64-1]
MKASSALASADPRLPIYARLRDLLAARIVSGEWPADSLIPSENKLSEEYGVAVGTIRRAIEQLVAEGLLERHRGTGTFVRRPAFNADLFRFFQIRTSEAEGQVIPESRILHREIVPIPEHVACLFGPESPPVSLKLDRVRRWGGEPLLAEEIHLRLPLFEDMQSLPDKESGPLLYPIFEQRFGVIIASATDELSIGIADEVRARLLRISPGAPVAVIERVARDPSGRVVEWRRAYGRSDRFRYRVSIS